MFIFLDQRQLTRHSAAIKVLLTQDSLDKNMTFVVVGGYNIKRVELSHRPFGTWSPLVRETTASNLCSLWLPPGAGKQPEEAEMRSLQRQRDSAYLHTPWTEEAPEECFNFLRICPGLGFKICSIQIHLKGKMVVLTC